MARVRVGETHLSVEGVSFEAVGKLLREFPEFLDTLLGLRRIAIGDVASVHRVEALGLQTGHN